MARRRCKTCRCPITLAEVVLLQGLLASGNYAADATEANEMTSNPAPIVDNSDSTRGLNGMDVYLEVSLNGSPRGLAHFVDLNGYLWASTSTLRELGFAPPAGTPDPVRLNSLQDVQLNYDTRHQTAAIDAPLRMLQLDTTVLNAPGNNRPKATASPGVLLNYDIYGTAGQGDTRTLSTFAELRAFNDRGVFSTTTLAQFVRNSDEWKSHSVRLDSSWSTSFPDSLLTLRLGDTLTDALSWSRSTRIAGIQVGTDFALQPYLITAPLPAFLGSATLPSNVQLYVNGVEQYNGKVPAGPFQLNTVPNIDGAGNAQVVLTDALGRTTTLNFSLYDEHQLLKQGLSAWSAELGAVREDYGLRSFSYGHDPVGSGTWRYGASDRITVEGHAEATPGLTNAGGGGAWLLGASSGVLSASLARSEHTGRRGTLYSLGYSWRDNRFNFSVSGTRTRGSYSDVATLYGPPPPNIGAQAIAGYSTAHWGNFGVSYLHLRYPQQNATRYGSAYWYRSIGQALSLNLNINQNLDKASDRSIFLIATLALDRNITTSGTVQRDGNRTGFVLNASQSPPSQGGFSWRADLREGDDQRGAQGELDYLGRYGQVAVGINSIGDTRYGYMSAAGALVLMGGGVFAARYINNGFAVVSTGGVANMPVKLENNPIGTTDRHG
ncbi:fimbria/pilus outer membrane usher protein, partial [Dyella sp.]|uniref:fimbria/pilus outer membrane usher protein n=1 Tax=Dyella sp. TaxID=1869338 RepID=UPI002F93FBFA